MLAITVSPRILLSHVSLRDFLICLMIMDRQYSLSIRYPAEPESHRDLDEQANRRKSVAGQTWIAKALDNSRAVSVETARWSTVDYTDYDMDPEQPMRKLNGNVRHAFVRMISVSRTVRLKVEILMIFFFQFFCGSSTSTRVRKMWTCLALKKL